MKIGTGQISTPIAALIIVVVVLASSTLYLAKVAVASGQTTAVNTVTTSPNSITVSGAGEASYTPNQALIQVSVQTNDATAEGATSSNAQDMLSVIRALNAIGVSNSSIQTQGYSLSVNYANCYSSCVPQIIGYSVTNSLQVNITSNDPTKLGLQAGLVIDTAVKAGATGISLSFSASDAMLSQFTNEALANAVASASSQAKAIASSLGVSISGVISASEGSGYYPLTYDFYSATLAVAAVSTPIVPGTQTVSATVQVVYSIS